MQVNNKRKSYISNIDSEKTTESIICLNIWLQDNSGKKKALIVIMMINLPLQGGPLLKFNYINLFIVHDNLDVAPQEKTGCWIESGPILEIYYYCYFDMIGIYYWARKRPPITNYIGPESYENPTARVGSLKYTL